MDSLLQRGGTSGTPRVRTPSPLPQLPRSSPLEQLPPKIGLGPRAKRPSVPPAMGSAPDKREPVPVVFQHPRIASIIEVLRRPVESGKLVPIDVSSQSF